MKRRHLSCILILIIPDIAALKESKGNAKDKRNSILNVFKNLELVFTGFYFHYDNVPEPEFEEIITETTKLRRQRFDEIAKKEKMINPKSFGEYFEYLSPSDMYKDLNKTTGLEESKGQVNTIKNIDNLLEAFESSPKSDAKKN